jgi:hypothetical protein
MWDVAPCSLGVDRVGATSHMALIFIPHRPSVYMICLVSYRLVYTDSTFYQIFLRSKFRFVFWDVLPCHRPDDGGSTYLWNVGRQLFYTAVHPRRQIWTSYSPPWELEISHFFVHLFHMVEPVRLMLNCFVCDFNDVNYFIIACFLILWSPVTCNSP